MGRVGSPATAVPPVPNPSPERSASTRAGSACRCSRAASWSQATALTTARERGADIVDLQDFARHADPRTTLGYIRNRDRLSRSPAYVLRY